MGFENFQPTHWNFTSDPTGHAFFITIILLSLLTLFFLGFLFFRLVCHRERNLPVITSATLMTITHHTISIPAVAEAAVASPSLGLDATTINGLPIFIHRSSSEDIEDAKTASYQESECSICLALYENEETVRVMPDCHHAFHSDCVDEWLRSRSTCPLCRLSLDSSSTGSVIP